MQISLNVELANFKLGVFGLASVSFCLFHLKYTKSISNEPQNTFPWVAFSYIIISLNFFVVTQTNQNIACECGIYDL